MLVLNIAYKLLTLWTLYPGLTNKMKINGHINMKSITTATINFIIISLQINVLRVSVNFFIMCAHAPLSNTCGLVRFCCFGGFFHNVHTYHRKQYS